MSAVTAPTVSRVRSSGVGSLPGTDFPAAVRLALSDASLPFVPELPARGPWAAITGRALGFLVELGAEFSAGEWRLAATPGIDQRRARATWRDDLEQFEEASQGFEGELTWSVCGPLTLAASTLRPLGGRVLADRGARRDLAQSLHAGVADAVAELRRRVPGARVIVQIDEPSLPAVLGGGVPTEGGYFRHRAVDAEEACGLLAPFAELGEASVAHCCAPEVPVALLTGRGPDGAGFGGVGLDGRLVTSAGWDAVAQAVDAGARLHLGVASSTAPEHPDVLARRALGWLRPLELGPVLADRLVLTPTCGLSGASVRETPRILDGLARAAVIVDERLRD